MREGSYSRGRHCRASRALSLFIRPFLFKLISMLPTRVFFFFNRRAYDLA